MPKTTEFTEVIRNLANNLDQFGVDPKGTDGLLSHISEAINNPQNTGNLTLADILSMFGHGAYGLIDAQKGNLREEIKDKTALSSRLTTQNEVLIKQSRGVSTEKRQEIDNQKDILRGKITESNAAITNASEKLKKPITKTTSDDISKLNELAQAQQARVATGKSWVGKEHKPAGTKISKAIDDILKERQNPQGKER